MNRLRIFVYKIKKKIKEKGGFTLTELLATTVIMMLSMGLLTGTLNLAIKQFNKSTQKSQARQLCQTLCVYVENELAYADIGLTGEGSLEKNAGGAVIFSSNSHDMGSGAYFAVVSPDGTSITPVNESSDAVGSIREYSEYNSKGYDIVGTSSVNGNGAYKVVGSGDLSLNAGMTISKGKKRNLSGEIEDDANSLLVHIWVCDSERTTLAEEKLRIIPMRVG